MTRRRQALLHAGPVALIALVLWLVFQATAINQDTIILLDWGRDLAHGRLPDYDASFAPTPHPLPQLVLGILSLPGQDFAVFATIVLSYLTLGALGWCVVLLGRAIYGWAVGLIAGVLVLTSAEILWRGIIGQQDVLAALLVLIAVLLEIERPRRGAAVLAVLAAAGLVRPEAWLLSAGYWLYLIAPDRSRPDRVRLTLLAAAGPALWVLTDVLGSGDPLFSARLTHGGAEALGRVTGIENVPLQLKRGFETVVGLVVTIGGLAGMVLALAVARERRAWPPAVLLLGWIAAFAVLGTARLSLNARYLFVASVVLCAFCAYALVAWTGRPRGNGRWAWALGAAALAAGIAVISIPDQVDRTRQIRTTLQEQGRALADLRELAEEHPLECKPLIAPNGAGVMWIAYAFDLHRGHVLDGLETDEGSGSFLQPRGDAFALVQNPLFRPVGVRREPPAAAQLVGDAGSWALYTAGCG